MLSIQYTRSVPRFLATRFLGPALEWIYTSPLGTTRLTDVPEPPLPSPGWVRVKPVISGICGSDIATITAKGSPYFAPFTSCPFVFGHEVVGEVVETGSAVSRVAVGQRVVLEPPLHCLVRGISDVCRECRNGHLSHCLNMTRGGLSAGVQTGYCRDTGGGWSQSFVAHEVQLHVAPGSLSEEAAVLIEPFSCCLQAAKTAGLEEGQTAVVVGCGTIGILTIAAARAICPGLRVIAIAKYPHQREWALRVGADQVLPSGPGIYEDVAGLVGAEVLKAELGNPVLVGGADVCFDCVGSSSTIDLTLRLAANHSPVVVVGMPGIPKGVDWTSIWYKELLVKGSYTSDRATFREAIQRVVELEPVLEGMVGARYPLERFGEAIHAARHSGRQGILKTAFVP